MISLIDSTGTSVVEYTYDAWGRILFTTGTLANTLGQANPFRYRGYYFDTESGFYYLQSRYYDPMTGRFINADDTSILQMTQGELLGGNLYAYCGNNGVMNVDPSGLVYIFNVRLSDGNGVNQGTVKVLINKKHPPLKSYAKSKLKRCYKEEYNYDKYLVFGNPSQKGIDPVFAMRLAAYARDNVPGRKIYITSNGGKRSAYDQETAYKSSGVYWDSRKGWVGGNGTAAVPGRSWHEFGEAIDIDKYKPGMMELREKLKDAKTVNQGDFVKYYGIFKPLTPGNGVKDPDDYEPWHFQPIETEGIYDVVKRKEFYTAYN